MRTEWRKPDVEINEVSMLKIGILMLALLTGPAFASEDKAEFAVAYVCARSIHYPYNITLGLISPNGFTETFGDFGRSGDGLTNCLSWAKKANESLPAKK